MVARQTTSGRPGQWYDDRVTLQDGHRHDDVAKARAQIRTAGKTETHGLIVAELMFGFWRLLLGPRHQTTLWAQSLRHAFPHLSPQRRSEVYDPVERLNRLRNRIAHHEPIYTQPLDDNHAALLAVTGYIDPDAAAWLHDISRVPQLLTTRPALASQVTPTRAGDDRALHRHLGIRQLAIRLSSNAIRTADNPYYDKLGTAAALLSFSSGVEEML